MATKDYAALAKAQIHKPNKDRPPTMLVYGRQKRGKTTFCTTAPNVLILDPETGTDFGKEDPNIWTIRRWEDLEDVYQFLKLGGHGFDYVAVDGMTRYNNMALRYVMSQEEDTHLNRKPGMVQKQDYNKSGELLKGLINNLASLPIGKIYTAQERTDGGSEDRYEDADEDVEISNVRYVPDLPQGVRGALCAAVDVIGRIYTVRKESTKTPNKMITVRRLWIGEHPLYDTGGRSAHGLPEMLTTPTVERLTNLITKGTPSGTSS